MNFYKNQKDKNIIIDLMRRKEFRAFDMEEQRKKKKIYEHQNEIIPKFQIDKLLKKNKNIDITSYNLFVQNFLNPSTPYKRLLLFWGTGIGKTIGSLSIAYNFIKLMKIREYSSEKDYGGGSVFIVGFSSQVFKSELLNYPEFGFITRKDRIKINYMIRKALENKKNIKKYKDFMAKKKRKLSNRKGFGFFKFMGYKTFFNKLLIFNTNNDQIIDIFKITEAELKNLIEKRKIEFNEELLKLMENSLIIFDEIHNTYNALSTNNWGTTIKLVLDKVKTLRAIFLSATPIMHNPSEIINLLNLLIDNKDEDYKKKDFFDKNEKPHNGAIERIGKLTRGYVSFVRDVNPILYATTTFNGENINNNGYLKFVRCPMSNLHFNTYKKVINNNKLPQEGQSLNDFVIPNPNNKNIGLYKTNEIITKLKEANNKWLEENNININEDGTITGDILKISNIGRISKKYERMMIDIKEIIEKKRGKIFIYHNYVHSSGVLFLKEILNRNGLIELYSNITKESICFECSKKKKNHEKEKHKFVAVKYILVHGDIDKLKLSQNLTKFNSDDNIDGNEIMIILGSKIMKEAYSLKAVRNVMIMARPDNIPTLIQILGRAKRKNAHNLLPNNKRNISVSIYTTTLPNKKLSYEESKYLEKICHFKIIQRIQKEMQANAIDATINYPLIAKKKKERKEERNILDILEYKPKFKIKYEHLNKYTFLAYHVEQEINVILTTIKRLFMDYETVWTYQDLLRAVRNPPYEHYYDMKLIEEDLFIIALNKLIWNEDDCYVEPIKKDRTVYEIWMNRIAKKNIYDLFLDTNEKVMYLPGMKVGSVIVHIDKYYILFPLNFYTQKPIINIELQNRLRKSMKFLELDLTEINKKLESQEFSYDENKKKFVNKWKNIRLDKLYPATKENGFNFQLNFLEEAIKYVFNVWTNKKMKYNAKMHEIYFKIVYYYHIMGIIIWGSTVKPTLYTQYEKYINNENKKNIFGDITKSHAKLMSELKEENIASVYKTREGYVGKYNLYYINIIKRSKKMFDKKGEKEYKGKVPGVLLPVGHYLDIIPRFYTIDNNWKEYSNYTKYEKKAENDIVVSYELFNKNNLEISFKLREPIHKLQSKDKRDKRTMNKGAVCITKTKKYLLEIMKKLEIKKVKNDKLNMANICESIKKKLLINESKQKDKKKWHYYFYEKQNPTLNIY